MDYYNDFNITSNQDVSTLFTERELFTFSDAALYIKSLPYKRNSNKNDIACVLKDSYGTCSTKHALLHQLAIENMQGDFKLMMGIYKMGIKNTPRIASVLAEYELDYIPEAHNYLKYHNLILDFTNKKSSPRDFMEDLLEEREITPLQITEFKANYHKSYISRWLKEEDIPYSVKQLWDIREKCIKTLSESTLVSQ